VWIVDGKPIIGARRHEKSRQLSPATQGEVHQMKRLDVIAAGEAGQSALLENGTFACARKLRAQALSGSKAH
jgi:hypothetical protein